MNKGKLKNMENDHFDEFFGLLSNLIKLCSDNFSKEKISSNDCVFSEELMKFDSGFILCKTSENVRLIQNYINVKKVSESKQSAAERLLSGYLLIC